MRVTPPQRLVIAYPTPPPWWRFWQSGRPHLLVDGDEYRVLPDESIEIFRPQRGWTYRVAFLVT